MHYTCIYLLICKRGHADISIQMGIVSLISYNFGGKDKIFFCVSSSTAQGQTITNVSIEMQPSNKGKILYEPFHLYLSVTPSRHSIPIRFSRSGCRNKSSSRFCVHENIRMSKLRKLCAIEKRNFSSSANNVIIIGVCLLTIVGTREANVLCPKQD